MARRMHGISALATAVLLSVVVASQVFQAAQATNASRLSRHLLTHEQPAPPPPARLMWAFDNIGSKAEAVARASGDDVLSALANTQGGDVWDDPQLQLQLQQQFNAWAARFGYSFTAAANTREFDAFLSNMQALQRVNTNSRIPFWLGAGPFAHISLTDFRRRLKNTSSTVAVTAPASRRVMRGVTSLELTERVHAQGPSSTEGRRRQLQQGVQDVNWLERGRVTPVRNQYQPAFCPGDGGGCGSCWAFVATAAVESAYLISQNINVSNAQNLNLSEEQLLRCCRGRHGINNDLCPASNGCGGGNINEAINYIAHRTLFTEADVPYSSIIYTSADQLPACDVESRSFAGLRLAGEAEQVAPNRDAIMEALRSAPVLTTFNAATRNFQMYQGGIYRETDTSCPDHQNHAMLLVGFRFDPSNLDSSYWMAKNSFGPAWGEQGYIRIGMTNAEDHVGICGMYSYVLSIPTRFSHPFDHLPGTTNPVVPVVSPPPARSPPPPPVVATGVTWLPALGAGNNSRARSPATTALCPRGAFVDAMYAYVENVTNFISLLGVYCSDGDTVYLESDPRAQRYEDEMPLQDYGFYATNGYPGIVVYADIGIVNVTHPNEAPYGRNGLPPGYRQFSCPPGTVITGMRGSYMRGSPSYLVDVQFACAAAGVVPDQSPPPPSTSRPTPVPTRTPMPTPTSSVCPTITGYDLTVNMDSPHNDILCTSGQDAYAAAAACSTNALCKGFNVDRRDVNNHACTKTTVNIFQYTPGVCFYSKQELLGSGGLRLVNGTYTQGRLEMYDPSSGTWGTVCDDNFGPTAAQAACRELGLGGMGQQWRTVSSAIEFGMPPADTFFDGFTCSGDEARLVSCSARDFPTNHDCTHSEDVYLDCVPPQARGGSTDTWRLQLLDAVNQDRRNFGGRTLCLNHKLNLVAQAEADLGYRYVDSAELSANFNAVHHRAGSETPRDPAISTPARMVRNTYGSRSSVPTMQQVLNFISSSADSAQVIRDQTWRQVGLGWRRSDNFFVLLFTGTTNVFEPCIAQ